jgi:signal recognition particle subunit SEC65
VTELVQVALAESVAEAEEIQEILREVGIEAELEPAVEHHPRETEDAPQKVLVPESEIDAAREAIESMTDPDELVSDA